MFDSCYSENYDQARIRFLDAAAKLNMPIESHLIDEASQPELCIDVATLGDESAPTVVISSGVHGVEGFFGSAIQLAFLERFEQFRQSPVRFVLVHAVNPFGFTHLRRFNEENIDLNRNFFSDASQYTGAPEAYAELNSFLNPESPPSAFEPFLLKAAWNIMRYGMQSLKQAIAAGQYEFPRGIFFGGSGPGASTQIIQQHCRRWFGSAEEIVHIDLHSGLGPFGKYKLLLDDAAHSPNHNWCADAFGGKFVEPADTDNPTAYTANGVFGEWLQQHFAEQNYRFVTAEFGTYGVVRVLAAIRAENRAHFYGEPNTPAYKSAKAELLECFCPKSPAWRNEVVESGLRIIEQATAAVMRSAES